MAASDKIRWKRMINEIRFLHNEKDLIKQINSESAPLFQEHYVKLAAENGLDIQALNKENEEIKFSDLELIFKKLKSLFIKQGYIIDWKELEKQNLDQTINKLAMASPFSSEEKQILLETINLNERKEKLKQILSTYSFDNFENKTIQ